MSQSKGAAKAAPAKKRARKVKTEVAKKQPVVAVEPPDWPQGLVETEVESFFNALESGDFTVKTAAKRMGRKGQEVYNWAEEYPRFAERLRKAIKIGCLMAEDSLREIAANDKNSKIAADVKFTGIDKWLKAKDPEKYHRSPINANAIQVNVGLNFEQELLAARQRAFSERGITITAEPIERPSKR